LLSRRVRAEEKKFYNFSGEGGHHLPVPGLTIERATMNTDSKRDAGRSDAKRGSIPMPIHPSGLFMSSEVNSPYAAAASALAMAAGGGGGGLLRSPPFLGAPGLGASAPPSPGSQHPGDNSALLALYQSPLWQAALRQQQLQLISQLASLNNPFLSAQNAASQSSGHPFGGASFPPSLEAAHLYRDYISKYAQAQSTAATSATTSSTSSPGTNAINLFSSSLSSVYTMAIIVLS
jgi:hypothetical protein